MAPSVSRPGVSAFLMQRRRVALIVRSIGMRNKKLEKTEVQHKDPQIKNYRQNLTRSRAERHIGGWESPMLRRAKHRTTSPASSGRKKRMIFTPPPLAISPGHDVGQRHAVAHNTDESSSPRTMAALRSLPPLRGGSSSPGTKERGPAVSVCVCVCACFYSCACTVCMPRGRADSRYTCPLSLTRYVFLSLPFSRNPPPFLPPPPLPPRTTRASPIARRLRAASSRSRRRTLRLSPTSSNATRKRPSFQARCGRAGTAAVSASTNGTSGRVCFAAASARSASRSRTPRTSGRWQST